MTTSSWVLLYFAVNGVVYHLAVLFLVGYLLLRRFDKR